MIDEDTRPDLGKLTDLCYDLETKQDELEDLEQKVKAKKSEIQDLQEREIPETMMELELNELTLSNGDKIKLEDTVYVSLRKDTKSEALDWLKENGFGNVIKNEVSTKFSAGYEDEAEQLCRQLEENGYTVQKDRTVHPSTLKSLAKEQLEHGVIFPDMYFSTHYGARAKVVKPK